MTGSRPRPPGQRPSRTRRSAGRVDPSRCYLCGAAASGHCPQCRRPVCDAHRAFLDDEMQPLFGPDACAECARVTIDDLVRGERQRARRRDKDQPYRTCALCGRKSEQVLPQCSRCGRHLCPEHAAHYRRRFRFGARDGAEAAWYWDLEVRCTDHLMNRFAAWLRRWDRDRTKPE